MARLTRKNIRVFAGEATNNGVFGSLQASDPTTTSDVEQIQSLSAWDYGWNSATQTSELLPPLEEFQGIQYVTTYQQAYLMQEGIPEWASSVTYYKGSLTKKITTTGFQIYCSLTDNNLGNILSDTENWKLVMDSDNLYAMANDVVYLAGTQTVTGDKTFSGAFTVQNSSAPTLQAQNTSLTKGTNPGAAIGVSWLKYTDGSGNNISSIYTRVGTNGDVFVGLVAYLNTAGVNTNAQLGITYKKDGTVTTTCPPSDAINSIVTTTGINKGANGYVQLGNGLIIQWGSAYQVATITLPTPFTSTNYKIAVAETEAGHEYSPVVGNKTTTSFGWFSKRYGDWIAIGY